MTKEARADTTKQFADMANMATIRHFFFDGKDDEVLHHNEND